MIRVLLLGTGGTIAGVGLGADQPWRYEAGQLPVSTLLAGLPGLSELLEGVALHTEQVAQVDSKDMGWSVWQALCRSISGALARREVDAIVITHGTDTLEETACLLHHLHDGGVPIVLTAAMRPATAPDADGPRNLRDALWVAQQAAVRGAGGVVAVMHGRVWAGNQVRKAHSHAIDAFDGGGALPLAELDDHGQARRGLALPWPVPLGWGWALMRALAPPRVEWVCSHADADGWLVDALLARACADVRAAGGDVGAGCTSVLAGLLVAGTGHGTLHQGLASALLRAQAQGVRVWRSTRVPRGGVEPREGDVWLAAGAWSAAQARVALQLHLLRERLLGPQA